MAMAIAGRSSGASRRPSPSGRGPGEGETPGAANPRDAGVWIPAFAGMTGMGGGGVNPPNPPFVKGGLSAGFRVGR